jgi:hypothetical protein
MLAGTLRLFVKQEIPWSRFYTKKNAQKTALKLPKSNNRMAASKMMNSPTPLAPE